MGARRAAHGRWLFIGHTEILRHLDPLLFIEPGESEVRDLKTDISLRTGLGLIELTVSLSAGERSQPREFYGALIGHTVVGSTSTRVVSVSVRVRACHT